MGGVGMSMGGMSRGDILLGGGPGGHLILAELGEGARLMSSGLPEGALLLWNVLLRIGGLLLSSVLLVGELLSGMLLRGVLLLIGVLLRRIGALQLVLKLLSGTAVASRLAEGALSIWVLLLLPGSVVSELSGFRSSCVGCEHRGGKFEHF